MLGVVASSVYVLTVIRTMNSSLLDHVTVFVGTEDGGLTIYRDVLIHNRRVVVMTGGISTHDDKVP